MTLLAVLTRLKHFVTFYDDESTTGIIIISGSTALVRTLAASHTEVS
jgi:hypothetical protein